jgi:hypothetical protein
VGAVLNDNEVNVVFEMLIEEVEMITSLNLFPDGVLNNGYLFNKCMPFFNCIASCFNADCLRSIGHPYLSIGNPCMAIGHPYMSIGHYHLPIRLYHLPIRIYHLPIRIYHLPTGDVYLSNGFINHLNLPMNNTFNS